MMCPADVRLRWSIIAASEVDLPEPVPPTTSTRPRLCITTSLRISGRRSFRKSGISAAMVRTTMPTCPCCTNTFTRNRETPGRKIAKLLSISWANSARCLSFISASASFSVTAPVNFCSVSGVIWPLAFMLGGKSCAMNRSEPPALTIAASSLCMYSRACSVVNGIGPAKVDRGAWIVSSNAFRVRDRCTVRRKRGRRIATR